MTTTPEPTEPLLIIRLYDAETGECLINTGPRRQTERERKATKGWLLRWRTGHKRHTGHGIRVEREEVAS